MNVPKPETVLTLAPSVRVRIFAGAISVQVDRGQIRGGKYALAILDAFATPTAFGAAVEQLRSRAPRSAEWLELVATILEFHRTGVLVEPGAVAADGREERVSYSEIRRHVAMLDDRDRTSSFVTGIARSVRPGDVVVDIGTGTGVLAIAAAAAGARHVYAIEATNMADLARSIVHDSGLSDRITVLHGWSSEVTLPERADLLVTELIGHEPLSEGILSVVLDARRRHLTETARCVPNNLRIFVMPVSIPEPERRALYPTAENLQNWWDWYALDARALRESLQDRSSQVRLSHERARTLMPCAPSALVAHVALATVDSPVVGNSVAVLADVDADIHAVLIYFEADLGGEITFTSHPEHAGTGYWGNPVFLRAEPLTVRRGDRLEISYAYRPGEPVAASVVLAG